MSPETNYSTISFSVDNVTSISTKDFLSNNSTDDVVDANNKSISSLFDVIFINIADEKPTLNHQPYKTEVNEIEVPKDGIYLIGMTENETTVLRDVTSVKSTSSKISSLGNFKIVSNGLDSLPLSSDASNDIQLGTLSQTDTSIDSNISTEESAEFFGYPESTLAEFANFDQTILKFLNPDINRNGIYDNDESLQWQFLVNYNIELAVPSSSFEDGVIETPPQDIYPWVSWSFVHMGSLDSHADEFTYEGTNLNENITLYFPEDVSITTNSGVPITSRDCYFADENQVVFDMDPAGMNPLPPYSGDYKIEIYGQQYWIDNVDFLAPDKNFENSLVLIFKQQYDENGYVTNFSWKWKLVKNGVYINPDPNLVKMQIKYLDVNWEYPGGTFHPQSGDGTEYYRIIEEYWLNGSFTPPSTVNAFGKMLSCTFEDTAGNSFVFSTQDSYVEEP